MSATHPVARRYLDELERGLGALQPDERREIVREIDDHIADAVAAGRPMEDVLQVLGPAQTLARAYSVETLLNPREKTPAADRWLRLIGLLAVASLPSFILIVVLGSLGLSFTVAGAAIFGAGVLTMAGVTGIMDAPPFVGVLGGPPLAFLGIACLGALYYYLRFLIRLSRATLARTRA